MKGHVVNAREGDLTSARKSIHARRPCSPTKPWLCASVLARDCALLVALGYPPIAEVCSH